MPPRRDSSRALAASGSGANACGVARPLGPAFVVGAVRGGLAALLPALLAFASWEWAHAAARPRGGPWNPDNLRFVPGYLGVLGVGLGIGDAVSVRLGGARGRAALFLAALAGSLAASAQSAALVALLEGHKSWELAPAQMIRAVLVGLGVGVAIGAGVALAGVPVPRAAALRAQGRGLTAAFVTALALWPQFVVLDSGSDWSWRAIARSTPLVPVLILVLGVLSALFGVGLRLSRPVAWWVRRRIEPAQEPPEA